MSTRGVLAIVKDGKWYSIYQHSDSYGSGWPRDVAKELSTMTNEEKEAVANHVANDVTWVFEGRPPDCDDERLRNGELVIENPWGENGPVDTWPSDHPHLSKAYDLAYMLTPIKYQQDKVDKYGNAWAPTFHKWPSIRMLGEMPVVCGDAPPWDIGRDIEYTMVLDFDSEELIYNKTSDWSIGSDGYSAIACAPLNNNKELTDLVDDLGNDDDPRHLKQRYANKIRKIKSKWSFAVSGMTERPPGFPPFPISWFENPSTPSTKSSNKLQVLNPPTEFDLITESEITGLLPLAEAKRCKAETQRNKQCKNITRNPTLLCELHNKYKIK